MGYDFEKMLTDFSRINKQITKNPTFLEISGYPYYENVCSNILAFFFDPKKEHGMSDLLLRSLFQCLPNKSYNLSDSSNVNVEREVRAGADRIDLVISSDSHVIGIENKIYHNAGGNPFDVYASEINERANGKKVILILLSLDKKTFTTSAALAKFESIIYPTLFEKIRLNLGDYITDANNKYLVFFLEFMKSIENYFGGNRMDNELVNFFEKHQDHAEEFYLAFNNYRAELRKMITELKNKMCWKEQEGKVLQYFFRESGQLRDCLVNDLIINENLTVAVDCEIAPYGWVIDIHARKGQISMVEGVLKEREIKFEKMDDKLRYKSFVFNEPIDNVHMQFEGVIKRILG